MPNNRVAGIFAFVIVVQVLGKYRTIEYLDPWGYERYAV